MKASELQPGDRFVLVDCEPYLKDVVYTARRPFGNEVECWNAHTRCCFIPGHQAVEKANGNPTSVPPARSDCCHKTVLTDKDGPMYCADCPLRAERHTEETHG